MGLHDQSYYRAARGDSSIAYTGITLALLALLFLGLALWSWYKAGIQQAVWERQGIHMSRWEVFIGVDPAQKSITIKQDG